MTVEDDIQFDVRDGIALVTLNRPKALNALTIEMFRALDRHLLAWAEDPAVRAVVIEGAGKRAFCAGGDIQALYRDGRGDVGETLFREEYAMNRRIRFYGKPYIALIDGVTMGGGVGVSEHGSHRVVTEHTLFAMPETGIGFFPDVGGSYFLPRLPGKLGMFLGLTGHRIKAADCLYCELADHYIERGRLEDVKRALRQADWDSAVAGADAGTVVSQVLESFESEPGAPELPAQRAAIDRCFSGSSLESIIAALQAEDSDWSSELLKQLAKRSPTSLKVTFRQICEGADLDFDAAMVMEYRLSQAFMQSHDFYEGVRALLIDKDNAPKWRPAHLEEVTAESVAAYFAPLGARDLKFD